MKRRSADGGFSLVELLVSISLLGIAGVSVLGAAAAAARGSGDHRQVADTQSVTAAVADAITGLQPVPCDDASRTAYRTAIASRLGGLSLGSRWSAANVEIVGVQEWDEAAGALVDCHSTAADALTPQLLTMRVTSPDGKTVRTVQAMTDVLPPPAVIGDVFTNESTTTTVAPATPTTSATTTTTIAPTTSAAPGTMSVGSIASPFAIVALGDVSLNGSFHVWGAAAVGGNLSFSGGAETGHNTAGTFSAGTESVATSLLVNGSIDFARSSGSMTVLAGYAHVGQLVNATAVADGNIVRIRPTSGSAVVNVNGNAGSQSSAVGAVVWPNLYDFVGAFDAFRKTSTALGSLPGQCVDAVAASFVDQNGNPVSSGNAWWKLQANKVNVLTTTAAHLAAMGSVNPGSVSPSRDTPLIVNVSDAGAVTLSAGSMTQNWSKSVIWNFPNATAVTVNGLLGGSLYAPRAQVTMNGEVRGSVIANSLAGGNEVKWADFVPDIRPIACERER